ncbi:VOC family protein [Isobaculum melis]|uniref:PhnB protein n=1 Tax=Isobaculum melis TaxID=142588 RepID=A0A1H9UHG6_9LACT|nr:glyoxalase/bleomycin resistance/extradiol dioxygenase family protein [Isobaculum melis]SES08886.1 PhnB protein [Isobaculum melis]
MGEILVPLAVYLNFRNESKEAIAFYEKVFETTCTGLMTYGDMPSDGKLPMDDATKQLVLNANLEVEGTAIMFSDIPEGMGVSYQPGDNITLVIDTTDEVKLTRQFNALAKEGKIIMPLEKTFWSDKYGHVIDKFGIGWQFSLK